MTIQMTIAMARFSPWALFLAKQFRPLSHVVVLSLGAGRAQAHHGDILWIVDVRCAITIVNVSLSCAR